MNAQNDNVKKDLLFVAEYDNYNDWYTKAFKSDALRRSQFCNESETKVGVITNNSSFIVLREFDVSKMNEFASDEKMGKLMKKFNVKHTEMYDLISVTSVAKMQEKANLFFIIKSVDYDLWLWDAFLPDAERRSNFCDESKTKVSKLNDKTALVALYDFDLTRMKEFESNQEVGKLMGKYKVTHDVYLMNKL